MYLPSLKSHINEIIVLTRLSTLPRSLLLYPHVRRSEANNIIWCAPTGRIYVTISVGVNIAQNLLYTLLRGAYVQAYNEVNQGSDGPLPGGTFTATTGNIVLRVWNANNHQTTWGVLGAAVWAVSSFKTTNNVYGAVNFNIYDGNNQVGQGTIG